MTLVDKKLLLIYRIIIINVKKRRIGKSPFDNLNEKPKGRDFNGC